MRFIFPVLFLVLFGSSNKVNATAIYLCEVEKWSQHFKQMEQTKSRYFTISKPTWTTLLIGGTNFGGSSGWTSVHSKLWTYSTSTNPFGTSGLCNISAIY